MKTPASGRSCRPAVVSHLACPGVLPTLDMLDVMHGAIRALPGGPG